MRIEKWDIGQEGTKILKFKTIDITLEPDRISFQLKTTLKRNFLQTQFGFPIKFSSNLTKVAVLNMIFDIGLMENNSAIIDDQDQNYSPQTISFPMTNDYSFDDFRITFSDNDRYVGYHVILGTCALQILGVYDLNCSALEDGHIWHKFVPSRALNFNLPSRGSDSYEFRGQSLEVAFHPTDTLIAWSGPIMGTFLTNFITETHSKCTLL
jgi:hypothetical protein